jgi:hypothetical protein
MVSTLVQNQDEHFGDRVRSNDNTNNSLITKSKTSPNTDNKGKLFFTLFAFAPAFKPGYYIKTNPDPRHSLCSHGAGAPLPATSLTASG